MNQARGELKGAFGYQKDKIPEEFTRRVLECFSLY